MTGTNNHISAPIKSVVKGTRDIGFVRQYIPGYRRYKSVRKIPFTLEEAWL